MSLVATDGGGCDCLYRVRSHCPNGSDEHFHYYELVVLHARFRLHDVALSLLERADAVTLRDRYETEIFTAFGAERQHHFTGENLDERDYRLNWLISDCILHAILHSDALLEIGSVGDDGVDYLLVVSDFALEPRSRCHGHTSSYSIILQNENGDAIEPSAVCRAEWHRGLAFISGRSGALTVKLRSGSLLLLETRGSSRLRCAAVGCMRLWSNVSHSLPLRYVILNEFKYFLRECELTQEANVEERERLQRLRPTMQRILQSHAQRCGPQRNTWQTNFAHLRHDELIRKFVQADELDLILRPREEEETDAMNVSPQQSRETDASVHVLQVEREEEERHEIYFQLVAQEGTLLFVTI